MADSGRTNVWEEVAGGLRRLLGGSWPPGDRPIAALLDLLVRGSKLQDDLRAVALDSPPVSEREPAQEEARIVQEELDTARADLPEFERALADAWRRSGGQQRELRYDSGDPAEDRAADVLIKYLVTTRTATVRTEDRPAEHGEPRYWYYIAVDWDALFALAKHLDVDLRDALDRAA
ncbi:MAG TPA: hypothetical protein VK066_30990 [Chloroflexota bacterium]|nr:hypothetical protein [Chloroflexota bacterium]